MESHASTHPQPASRRRPSLGLLTLPLALAIILAMATAGPAETQPVEMEPGPFSYQHAQLMADVQANRSFGERRAPVETRVTVRDDELTDLCTHLDSLEQQIRRTEQRLDSLSSQTGPWPQETTEVVVRTEPGADVQVEVEVGELTRHRQQLVDRADRQTTELRDLRNHLANREREIITELEEIHEQMRNIENQLVNLDRRRQEHLERLVDARNQIRELNARLRELMNEVSRVRRNVDERIGQNRRQEEVIHNAIDRTRGEAQRIRTELEDLRRTEISISEPGWRTERTEVSVSEPAWRTERTEVRVEEPVRRTERTRITRRTTTVPSETNVDVEIQLLRDELVQLRQQLAEPRRVEVVYVENPYAVGTARGYYLPCR